MKVEIEIDDKLYTQDVDNFVGVVTDMINLYAKKNHDYGNSFNKGCEVIGTAYAVGRMFDKMNRIINLMNKPTAISDEKVTDTIQDLANYSVMYLAWLNSHADRKTIVSTINNRTIRLNNEEPTQGYYDISQSDAD